MSSIITIIGAKLAGKAPDKKHPYGYGHIEYITSLIVSAIVLYAGITAFVESVKKIVFAHKGILQMHGFYLDDEDKTLGFDIIIDFKAKDREKIYQEIYDQIQSKFKEYKIMITLDIDISD